MWMSKLLTSAFSKMQTAQSAPGFYRHTQITAPSLAEQADARRRQQELEERIAALDKELQALRSQLPPSTPAQVAYDRQAGHLIIDGVRYCKAEKGATRGG